MRFYRSENVATVQESLQEIVSRTLGLDKEQIINSNSFLADMPVDSLDIVEVVMALEDEFGLTISEDDLQQMKTVADVIDYILRHRP